jgi:hypothetical protein
VEAHPQSYDEFAFSGDDEDNLNFTTPHRPSELRQISNEELFMLWRKIAFANMHQWSSRIQNEMNERLIIALNDHAKASARGNRVMVFLTVAVALLTVVLVLLTVVLVVKEFI